MKLSEVMKKYYGVDLGSKANEYDKKADAELMAFETMIINGTSNNEPIGLISQT